MGKCIGSEFGLNTACFVDDASFIEDFEGDELVLKVSNDNIENTFVYKEDKNYIILQAQTIPQRPKCRFQIIRPWMTKSAAASLERELLRLRQDMLINAFKNEIVSRERNTLTSSSIVLNDTEYIITRANNARPDCISLYNPVSKMFIRHYNSKLIESTPNLNALFFLADSSFIKESDGKKLILKISNKNIANSYVYKQDNEYIILPAHKVPERAKCRFEILSKKIKKEDSLILQLEILKLNNDCTHSIIQDYLISRYKKFQAYQTTTILCLLRYHNISNFAKFTDGTSLWNFIEHKNHIKCLYGSYEQLELFFYQRFNWDPNLFNPEEKTDLYLYYGAYNSKWWSQKCRKF